MTKAAKKPPVKATKPCGEMEEDPANDISSEGLDMFVAYIEATRAMRKEAASHRADNCIKCIHHEFKYKHDDGKPFYACHFCARDNHGSIGNMTNKPDLFKEA